MPSLIHPNTCLTLSILQSMMVVRITDIWIDHLKIIGKKQRKCFTKSIEKPIHVVGINEEKLAWSLHFSIFETSGAKKYIERSYPID